MSIEEIIKWLEGMIYDPEEVALPIETVLRNEMAREAIALLKTHPDAQPNEPLTLEELRDMCEPVWVSVPGLKSGGYWCLCKNGTIIPPSCNEFRSSDIPNWVFYRRPPKET